MYEYKRIYPPQGLVPCRACIFTFVGLKGFWEVDLIDFKGPDPLFPRSLRFWPMAFLPIIFSYRFDISFFWILVPTWCQLASQNGPKIDQKSIQEPSNIHPNIHLIIDHFFNRFLMIFYWFFDAPESLETLIFWKQSTRKPVFSFLGCLLLGCLLEPNLALFWEGFGRVLGGKLDLKS